MEQLQSVWNALDGKRRILAIGASAAMFAAIMMLTKIATAPGMSLLYAGLEEAAAGEVIQSLEARGIAYDVRAGAIYVPSRVRDETRLMMAANGLPANAHSGYEVLDSLTGFGTTSQMFDAAYWRAKEGELARTIVAGPHIRAARVHIAQASSSGFRRGTQPTASVTVTTTTAALTVPQARAIRFLIASAVAGMTPEDVSVIDGAGGLVHGPETDTGLSGPGGDRTQELRRNVERILEAHVGHGRAVVELSIETLTDREVIHERRLDPESRVAISSEVEENNTNNTDTRQQGVTVASNLPDGDAAATDGSAQSRETQSRQRTNFEVSETRREVERNPGAVRRMTVAVLIDGVRTLGEDGTPVWAPRPAEELEALRELVASAVGFDEARGDVITLRSLPFEPISAIGTEASSGMFSLTTLDVMSLIKWAFLLIAVLVIALFVLRPILRAGAGAGRARPSQEQVDGYSPALLDAASTDSGVTETMRSSDYDAPSEDPIERMRQLIEARGDESVQVLRHWMDERKEPS
ncbi:MAG: flagellar M-ring protein FliF [Roseinatronobacter sp.]|nr:MAG: flagellar M-ring protein FliF [Roseinatronobacter sp.]